jgi:hypothetical protein
MSNPKRTRTTSVIAAALVLAVPLVLQAGASPAGAAGGPRSTTVVYDSFSKPGGYTLTDYAAKWGNGFGLGEMALNDTRNFAGNAFNISAAPFQTANDFSVFDHLKYIAISNQAFPVPADGSVEISSTIQAATPGTQPGRVIHGVYTATGAPYAEPTLEGQQAGAVMNVVDFATGQLFDWFISGSTAFALIERLPSNVTGNTSDTSSPDYVGREKMYTQIIKEVPAAPGVAHKVSIRFSRNASGASVDYYLDDALVASADRVGVPLDVQGEDYTGIYPSLGAGEEIAQKINHLVIGHGLFSLLDAFPFQHPESPELSVSIPITERAFGQGAIATFDSFKVKTTTNK